MNEYRGVRATAANVHFLWRMLHSLNDLEHANALETKSPLVGLDHNG